MTKKSSSRTLHCADGVCSLQTNGALTRPDDGKVKWEPDDLELEELHCKLRKNKSGVLGIVDRSNGSPTSAQMNSACKAHFGDEFVNKTSLRNPTWRQDF